MSRIRHKLGTVIQIATMAGLLASCLAQFQSGISVRAFFVGFLDGFCIGGLLGAYSLFIVKGALHELERRVPFLLLLFANSVVYSGVILLTRALLLFLTGRSSFVLFPWHESEFRQALVLAAGLSFVINFMLQLGQLLGQHTLWNFLRGKYHTPIEEERFIMYLDMVGSTATAEKVGDLKYLHLLDDCFHDLTDAVLVTGAEIHKYVGDEAILLWSTKQGRKTLNCVRFFWLFEVARQKASAKYARRYDLQPEFRAGLHFGRVVAGEMGNLRKEVAYLGDAMNTGARMLDAAKRMNRQIVLSESAREALGPNLEAEDLGAHSIRGKQNEMRLYSVDIGAFERVNSK